MVIETTAGQQQEELQEWMRATGSLSNNTLLDRQSLRMQEMAFTRHLPSADSQRRKETVVSQSFDTHTSEYVVVIAVKGCKVSDFHLVVILMEPDCSLLTLERL